MGEGSRWEPIRGGHLYDSLAKEVGTYSQEGAYSRKYGTSPNLDCILYMRVLKSF